MQATSEKEKAAFRAERQPLLKRNSIAFIPAGTPRATPPLKTWLGMSS